MRSLFASILMVIVLTTPVWSMQDDSMLKVFEFKPSEMVGMNDSIPNDDTKLSSELQNFVTSPSGVFTLPKSANTTYPGSKTFPANRVVGTIYEVPGRDYPFISTLTDLNGGSATMEILIEGSGTYSAITAEVGCINPSLFYVLDKYNGGSYTYILHQNHLLRIDNATLATTNITVPWTKAIAGTMFQGHLIVAESYSATLAYNNRIFWSSNTNPEDWTTGVNRGGNLDLPVNESILSMQSTLQGLVILTNGGAWVLSGPSPESWQLDKIFSLRSDFNQFTGIKGLPLNDSRMAFVDFYSNLNLIENLQFSQLGSLYGVDTAMAVPNALFLIYSMALWDNRYIVIPEYNYTSGGNPYATYSGRAWSFDMSTKTWSKLSGVKGASPSWIVTDTNMLYSRGTLKPSNTTPDWSGKYDAYYMSTPQTMDDNHQTLKDVVRMEVDCQVKNGTTFEVGLKNDAVSRSKIFTSATESTSSYVFYPNLGSASRDHQCWFKSSSASQIKGIRLYYIPRGNLKVNGGK